MNLENYNITLYEECKVINKNENLDLREFSHWNKEKQFSPHRNNRKLFREKLDEIKS